MKANIPFSLLIINTLTLPTGALVQVTPSLLILEWIHLSHTPRATLTPKPSQLAFLINKGRQRSKSLAGIEPSTLFVPCSLVTWELLLASSEPLQFALADWPGTVSCHPPPDPRFQLMKTTPFVWHSPFSPQPIPDAITVFADGSKTYGACAWQLDGQWHTKITPPQASAQHAELNSSLLAFQEFSLQPFNLILDSLYVFQLISQLYEAYLSPSIEPALLSLFLSLQHLISARTHSFHVAHIRSHQPFPGMIQEGNDIADAAAAAAARSSFYLLSTSVPTPWESHSYFHQNKKALIKQFGITAGEATAILQQCPSCSKQAHSIPMGVNPRGTECCQIWQMDVTQYASFSPWKYLHVSIDTYSGFIMATPQRGEATKHVMNHCIRTFATLGRPKELKTDNGPAYTSSAFAAFCQQWGIIHKFGIPYNSQGQAIVERANQTLKHALDRYIETKGKGPPSLPAVQDILNLCLYTLNFLNLIGQPATSAACRHFASQPVADHQRPLVYYRCLPDLTWKGPAQLITWGRGYAAVQLPDRALWVPARHTRPYLVKLH